MKTGVQDILNLLDSGFRRNIQTGIKHLVDIANGEFTAACFGSHAEAMLYLYTGLK